MESAGELELDLCSIVEWGDRWLSFNRHSDPVSVPVKIKDIGLPEDTSFHLLGLAFTRFMDWNPYIPSIAKAASRSGLPLYGTAFPYS